MANKYKRRLVDDYTIVRISAKKATLATVEGGKITNKTDYTTESQASEIAESLKGSYIVGYSTLYDLKNLNKYADTDVEYGEVSKMLKSLVDFEGKASLAGYCTAFEIEGEDDCERLNKLYELIKRVAKGTAFEETVLGKGTKKADTEFMRLSYADEKDEDEVLEVLDDNEDEDIEILDLSDEDTGYTGYKVDLQTEDGELTVVSEPEDDLSLTEDEEVDEIDLILSMETFDSEPENTDDLFSKEEAMETLYNIFEEYHEGYPLWTKWVANHVNQCEDEDDVTGVIQLASADLEGDYLKQFYFHLRDDLGGIIPEQATEYSARTQIMCMCMDVVVNKGASRIYSEMAEGIYSEYVLNQADSLQAHELEDLEKCDLDNEWGVLYQSLFGRATFPLEQDSPILYEAEIDLDKHEVSEDVNRYEYEELDIEDMSIEPEMPNDDIDDLLHEEDIPMAHELPELTEYEVPEIPTSDLSKLAEPIEQTDYDLVRQGYMEQENYELSEDGDSEYIPEDLDMSIQPNSNKNKKKKKKGIFRKILRFIGWLVVIGCFAGMSLFCYGSHKENKKLREDNVKMQYELKDAKEGATKANDLRVYKGLAQNYDQYIIRLYKNKDYAQVVRMVEIFYGKDEAKMSDTIKPLYASSIKQK